MLRYTNRFAEELMAYADEKGLEHVYRQALQWVTLLDRARRDRAWTIDADTQSAAQPGAQPGAHPSAQPGAQPGAHPSAQPGAQPVAQPAAHPSAQPGAQPAAQPAAQPGAQPGAQPAIQPSAQPDAYPGAQPGAQLAAQPDAQADIEAEPPLGLFLAEVPHAQREAVIDRFIDMARDRLGIVEAEVTSAVPLTPGQQQMIEIRLIKIFKKKVDLTAAVDPSLIGGVRIAAGGIVIDDTIKRKLSDMKNGMYKGVFNAE